MGLPYSETVGKSITWRTAACRLRRLLLPETSAVPYSLSNDITFDSETVGTSAENLELDYRVFTRGGERMLEMTILNRAAADGRSSRTGGVTLRAWADGDESSGNLPLCVPSGDCGRTHAHHHAAGGMTGGRCRPRRGDGGDFRKGLPGGRGRRQSLCHSAA